VKDTEPPTALRLTLRGALGVILPSVAETCLLRSALYSGEEGRQAWRDWQRHVVNPLTAFAGERSGQKSLLPLLHAAVVRNSVEVEAAVGSWLRATYFREELRGNAYRRILRETLSTLSGTGRPPIVLKGCALSDTVYRDPNTRHSHGIELLVRECDIKRVADRLPDAGFAPVRGYRARRSDLAPLSWTHASGLPLELRTRLFDVPRYDSGVDALWERARPLPGFAALQLGPEDTLLHICGSATSSGSRSSLRWACDAWLLIDSQRSLDWTMFVSIAKAARIGLPLSIVLRYLAESLRAPIPTEVLEAVDVLADATDDVGHEAAVLGALVGTHAKMRRLIVAAPNWSTRWILMRCLLAPTPACVRDMGWVTGSRTLVAFYVMRPLLYAGRRLARLSARSNLVLSDEAELR